VFRSVAPPPSGWSRPSPPPLPHSRTAAAVAALSSRVQIYGIARYETAGLFRPASPLLQQWTELGDILAGTPARNYGGF